jgi:N-methylhydantoinase A
MEHEYVVGIDIGGTFTDSVAIDARGDIARSKALTRAEDLSMGVLDSVTSLAEAVGQPLNTFLASVRLIVNGSTIATNVMAQLRGPKLGLLTTKGFEDTVRIARSYRFNTYDLHQQVAPPELVTRRATIGITERIDYRGRVVVPLARDEVAGALTELVEEQGAESIAVSFIWSPRNGSHELEVGAMLAERYPNVRYSLSHEVFRGIREYERTMTALINAYVAPATSDYMTRVETSLRNAGFAGRLCVMHSMGGVIDPAETARLPVTQILSGPVGGVCGANYLGKLIGVKDIITADVGGTSFDTSLIHNNELRVVSRTHIPAPGSRGPGYLTGLSLIDISAIGAGGGSIAWIDPRGLLRVGPSSAGSDPGPVAFGRGGREPTLTDACLTMGILDPEFYLGGTMKVDAAAAREAIEQRIAGPLGMTADAAAAAVYEVLVASMSSNVRAVSIRKGFDPRDFAMVSYGGAGGMILPAVCQASSVRELVVPDNAATFSAFGLLTTDYKRDYLATVHWRPGDEPAELNDAFRELEEGARLDLANAGFDPDTARYDLEVDMRFVGQFFELTITIDALPLEVGDLDRAVERFNVSYEREYGEGTGWIGAPTEIIHARIHAIAELPAFHLRPSAVTRTSSGDVIKGERDVYMRATGRRESVPVYDQRALYPSVAFEGPAIVEGIDTTVLLLPGMRCHFDEYSNLRVEVESI